MSGRFGWAILLWMCIGIACRKPQVPTQKYSQYSLTAQVNWESYGAEVRLINPLKCPLRVWIQSQRNDSLANQFNPLVLKPLQDTTFILPWQQEALRFFSKLGDVRSTPAIPEMGLPFPKSKAYRVTQGNRTNFTHQGPYAQYAVDFDLATGDTISAATSGVVVGVVRDYHEGGNYPRWRDFSNFITIFDPQSGVFTQYVHLQWQGALVAVGDSVRIGDPIGLAGSTGYSTAPHLHFACLVPVSTPDGLKSVPFRFSTGQKSTDLRVGEVLP